MSAERIIGIDFGTSTSVIRVKRYSNGQPVDDRLSKQDVIFNSSSPMVPTLIQRTNNGTYYGYEALVNKKGSTIYQNFKINLESSDVEVKKEARALTEEFFAYMAKEYKSQSEGGHFGEQSDVEKTIVSYPVKWSDDTKAFMIKAAQKAGFKNVEGVDEAQAAIHAVTVQSEDYLTKNGLFRAGIPCNILLIDMGAGTTDLVLCRHTPGKKPKNEILCTWPKKGDILFGGSEVEGILSSYVKTKLPEDTADIILKNNGAKEFKTWKETVVSPALSRNEIVEEFSNIDMLADALGVDVEPYDLDRNKFETYANDYLSKLPKLIKDCIEASGLDNSKIELVILTGGHSQWYFVKEMLTDISKINLPLIQKDPKRIIQITRPQETVALGMVYKPLSADIKAEMPKGTTASTANNTGRNTAHTPKNTTVNASLSSLSLRQRYTMPTNREEIIRYYQRNARHLIHTTNDKSGWAVFAVRCDGVLLLNDLVSMRDIEGDVAAIGKTIRIAEPYIVKNNGCVVKGTFGSVDSDYNNYKKSISAWRDIVLIDSGVDHTVGLKNDGTVVGTFCDTIDLSRSKAATAATAVKGWRDIKSIACGFDFTIGLKEDGTIYLAGENLGSYYAGCRSWRDIVQIDAGLGFCVGLKNYGTIAVHDNIGNFIRATQKDQCWDDIVSVAACYDFIIGVKSNGTVVTTDRIYGVNFDDWHNIIAVVAEPTLTTFTDYFCIIGITDSGEVLKKVYQVKRSFLSGAFKSCTLLESKRFPWKLF